VGATDALALPFPELTETADGPDAFSDLADAIEDYFYDRTLPAGITRMPSYFWGSGVTPPATTTAGLMRGDTYYHTGQGVLLAYNGAQWRPVGVAAPGTDSAPYLADGQVRAHATNGLEVSRSSLWVPTQVGNPVLNAYSGAVQSLGNSSFQQVNIDTDVTLQGFTRVATNRFRPNVAGHYLIWSMISWAGNTTGRRIPGIGINGSLYSHSQVVGGIGTSATYNLASAPAIIPLDTADQISAMAYQDSGVALNINAGGARLHATLVG
jgi:hypothetical protein